MQGLLGNRLPNLASTLFAGPQANAASLLYATDNSPAGKADLPANTALFDRTLRLEPGGRAWTLFLHTLPDHQPADPHSPP